MGLSLTDYSADTVLIMVSNVFITENDPQTLSLTYLTFLQHLILCLSV